MQSHDSAEKPFHWNGTKPNLTEPNRSEQRRNECRTMTRWWEYPWQAKIALNCSQRTIIEKEKDEFGIHYVVIWSDCNTWHSAAAFVLHSFLGVCTILHKKKIFLCKCTNIEHGYLNVVGVVFFSFLFLFASFLSSLWNIPVTFKMALKYYSWMLEWMVCMEIYLFCFPIYLFMWKCAV